MSDSSYELWFFQGIFFQPNLCKVPYPKSIAWARHANDEALTRGFCTEAATHGFSKAWSSAGLDTDPIGGTRKQLCQVKWSFFGRIYYGRLQSPAFWIHVVEGML